MSGQIEISYDDGTTHHSTQVAGEFTSWQPVPLGLDEGTTYAAVFHGAEPGQSYSYKFIIDDQWKLLPGAPTVNDSDGNVNHSVVATATKSDAKEGISTISAENQNKKDERSVSSPYSLDNYGVPIPTAPIGGYSTGFDPSAYDQPQIRSDSADPTSEEFSDARNEPFSDNVTYEYVGSELPKSSEAVPGLDKLNLGSQGPGDTYEYTSGELPMPVETVKGLDQINTSTQQHGYEYSGDELSKQVEAVPGLDQVNTKPAETYEYSGSELPKSVEVVKGLDEINTSGKQADAYEYTSNELPKPVEAVPGLDQVNASSKQPGYEYRGDELPKQVEAVPGIDQINTKPADTYEYTSNDLSRSVEAVPGLDQVNTSDAQPPASQGYEYTGSEIPRSVEAVPGLDQVNSSARQEEKSSFDPRQASSANQGYEYSGSELPKSVEAVPGLDNLPTSQKSDPQHPAYNYAPTEQRAPEVGSSNSGVPGSLPFEESLVGRVEPQQVTEGTLSAIGGRTDSSNSGVTANTGFQKELQQKAGEVHDEFYESRQDLQPGLKQDPQYEAQFENELQEKAEEFHEDFNSNGSNTHGYDAFSSGPKSSSIEPKAFTTESPAFETAAAPSPRATHGYTRSYDRSYDSSNDVFLDASHGKTSSLDKNAAERAVNATYHPSGSNSSRRSYQAVPRSHHQPIDVNTGFPIDNYQQSGSNIARGTSRRSDKRRSVQNPPNVVSTEHRNAAVIAAAAKASAFAKQDVAAISNPPKPAQYGEEQGVPMDYVPANTPSLPVTNSPKKGYGETSRSNSVSTYARGGDSSYDFAPEGTNQKQSKHGGFRRFFKKFSNDN